MISGAQKLSTSRHAFFAKMRTYADLSTEAEQAWSSLLRSRQYTKDEAFIRAGDIPTTYAFVVEGLLYQHYVGPDGNLIIKHFFPENRIAASVSATLLGEPSAFSITAIEGSTVLEYDFAAFRSLVRAYPDVAACYIGYMERHWIIEKEPSEIAFRHDDAMQRYLDFMRKEPELHKRLKQHHIAAWLGITPESLSRLRKTIAMTRPDKS